MKGKFCKWFQAITFGLVCFGWCKMCCNNCEC